MAASSDLFKNPHLQQPSRFQQKQQSKSCFSNFFCKCLIIVLVLLVVPLFPAQAPEFMNKSILSKFWELLHLLIIGVAVSYGLFCRKCVKFEVENQCRNDGSHAYLSGILNVSSFFEDGFENLCISDEKKNVENWDALYLRKESACKESSSNGDGKKLRSFAFGNGIMNICEADRENVSKIWNSQYFEGETLVVVADGNCALDEHKPLGLPVRSLRSRNNDTEKPEFNDTSGSSSILKCSFGDSSNGKVNQFKGPISVNLEKKFEQFAGPSTIPCQSRSGRTEMREEVSNAEAPPHRPHSGGDFEFQSLKSRSFRHPISSVTSSVSLELSNPNTESLESKKDLKGSLEAVSQENAASVNGGATFNTKARGFSIGSSRELGGQRTSKNYLNEFNISAMQEMLDREKKSSDSLNSDAKPSKLAKILAKGRSVRTIRSDVFASDEMKRKENFSSDIDDKVGAMRDHFEAPVLMNKVKGAETKDPSVHNQNQNSNKVHPEPKARVSGYQNDERQDFTDSASLSTKDSELESESGDFQESSNEKEAESHHLDDAELKGCEVDKKADEFIAKFREQMRLQKVASFKRYSFRA